MNQGKILEYIDRGKIQCSLCLQDNGSRLHLLTPLNRQVNLPLKRSLVISTSTLNLDVAREELIATLKQADESRERLQNEIKVRELWDLIKDENEQFSYRYLAQLCFGDEVTDDHISAVVRAIFYNKLYFKMKDSMFLPNSEKRVEQIIKQKEEEAIREENLQKGSAWLKEVLRKGIKSLPEEPEGVIDTIINLALHGKNADEFIFGKELLSRAGISNTQKARNILIKLGVWGEDEPIDLLRFNIPTYFSEKQLKESTRCAKTEINPLGREDLRELPCFTIDGPLTRDFDDALSVEIKGDYLQIGVHISDVAGLVNPNSLLDKEALSRGSSLYLPRREVPMLPNELSQNTLSLLKGCDRPAISLLAGFDKRGNLYDYRFVPSLINVKQQLTYDQVNEELIDKEPFNKIYQIMESLRRKRVEQDALNLSLADVMIKIDENASISFEKSSQETPSRLIIAEFMILYNWLIARLCRDNNIPTLYRTQKGPSEILTVGETGYLFYVFRQRRKLCPLVIDTKPSPHAGLGLEVYSNASSPIRRYYDLITQRQVRQYLLDGSFPYNMNDLDKFRMRLAPILKDLNIVKRNRNRYWILKYLKENKKVVYKAIILDVLKTKYRIIIEDFLFTAEIKHEGKELLTPGEKMDVRVTKSDPWNDELNFERV